ncbi:MAG: sigma-70 family RNA polymerase sigma factor [Acidobacteria bacterium]|nr:sigma-70 family RNA polymerase sigma factor [Acidobacteriota bacterium]
MPAPPAGEAPDVTALLLRWNAGDPRALDDLTPVLYDDLRRVARGMLLRETPGHTLSATALVHEAYLRLVDQRRVRWENRAHFFGVAAHIMRRVLVDHARARATAKRGGSATKVAIPDDIPVEDLVADDVLSLDAALARLAALDPRKVRVVEMKFFAGMTNLEIAEALAVSDATVERDWKMARAWLIAAMDRGGAAGGQEP